MSQRLATFTISLAALLAGCSSPTATPAAAAPADAGVDAPASDGGSSEDADAAPPPSCPEGTAFQSASGKITLDATFNGKTVKVIYDTGAPYSGLDSSMQSVVGNGPYTVTFAGKTVTLPSVTFASTSSVAQGIIGTDVVGKFAVTIDYPRSRLWLDDQRDEAALSACTHVEGRPALVDAVIRDYVYVQGHLESKPGWFIVDTGASLGAVQKSVFAELVAAKPRAFLTGFYTPAAIGTFWASLGMVGAVETGGQTVNGILVRTIDDGMLGDPPTADAPLFGVLPHDYLANFLVTVDFPQKKLRLDAAKDAKRVGATRMWVTGISLEETENPPVHVASVLPGSAAAEQGVTAGDEVTKIGSTTIDTMSAYERPWRLVSGTATSIPVTIVHDAGSEAGPDAGAPRDLTLDTRDLLTVP